MKTVLLLFVSFLANASVPRLEQNCQDKPGKVECGAWVTVEQICLPNKQTKRKTLHNLHQRICIQFDGCNKMQSTYGENQPGPSLGACNRIFE